MFNALLLALALHSGGTDDYVRGWVRGQPVDIEVKRIPGRSLDGRELVLQKDAAGAWADLLEYALRNGVDLRPTYAFRTDEQQRRLKRRLPRLAAKVGWSTHQAGVSLDIDAMRRGRKKTSLFWWMVREAPAFGFVNDVRREPWHWSFQPPREEQLLTMAE